MEYRLNTQSANGMDVLNWFSSGAREVAAHIKYLNLINVFPVADGDTGTNIATTLRAMVEMPARSPSFSQMLQDISQAGLENARGNSGIIFASYVSGLAQEGSPYEHVGLKEFARVAYGAVKYLYKAVEHPQEGTLMSIIRDWATFLQYNHEHYHGFADLFTDAYRASLVSLEKTKTQLAVLRKNNVVDSGAAGFVRFLEGINRVFAEGHPMAVAAEEEAPPIAITEESIAYRYCTEALVDVSHGGTQDDEMLDRLVQQALDPLGDSLIAASRNGRLKVHIHTNTPELVMERLAPLGTLLSQKADDMALQNRLRMSAVGGVGLITDSIADVPDAFLLENRVSVLAMGVMAGDAAYLDKTTIRLPQLFREMERPDDYPTSSQPEPARIKALLAARLEQFDSLIVLSVADKLSGTYQALVQAARQLETPEKRITVIDTRLNSGAQGLLVRLAADMLAQGHSHEEIVQAVTQRIPRTHIYVCLNTLAYAVRGGRVPNTVGRLGMKIGLRPIMTLDKHGHGAAFGVAFSQAGLTRKIMKLVRKAMRHGGIEA
ncbi:MAG: DegV family EDD domain-containing protein, partial [Clostridia bacterium]|nr:DegV family EDD domain-containing protein [Clostridia bacterium]